MISWRPRPELNRGKRFCRPLRNHSATWPSEGSSLNVYSRLGNGWRRWAAAGRDGGALRVSRPHHPSRLSNAAVDARLTGSRNPSRRRFLERKALTGPTEISTTIGARSEFEGEVDHIRRGRPHRRRAPAEVGLYGVLMDAHCLPRSGDFSWHGALQRSIEPISAAVRSFSPSGATSSIRSRVKDSS